MYNFFFFFLTIKLEQHLSSIISPFIIKNARKKHIKWSKIKHVQKDPTVLRGHYLNISYIDSLCTFWFCCFRLRKCLSPACLGFSHSLSQIYKKDHYYTPKQKSIHRKRKCKKIRYNFLGKNSFFTFFLSNGKTTNL